MALAPLLSADSPTHRSPRPRPELRLPVGGAAPSSGATHPYRRANQSGARSPPPPGCRRLVGGRTRARPSTPPRHAPPPALAPRPSLQTMAPSRPALSTLAVVVLLWSPLASLARSASTCPTHPTSRHTRCVDAHGFYSVPPAPLPNVASPSLTAATHPISTTTTSAPTKPGPLRTLKQPSLSGRRKRVFRLATSLSVTICGTPLALSFFVS